MTEMLKKLHKENEEMKRNQGKTFFLSIGVENLRLILKPVSKRNMSMWLNAFTMLKRS